MAKRKGKAKEEPIQETAAVTGEEEEVDVKPCGELAAECPDQNCTDCDIAQGTADEAPAESLDREPDEACETCNEGERCSFLEEEACFAASQDVCPREGQQPDVLFDGEDTRPNEVAEAKDREPEQIALIPLTPAEALGQVKAYILSELSEENKSFTKRTASHKETIAYLNEQLANCEKGIAALNECAPEETPEEQLEQIAEGETCPESIAELEEDAATLRDGEDATVPQDEDAA